MKQENSSLDTKITVATAVLALAASAVGITYIAGKQGPHNIQIAGRVVDEKTPIKTASGF